MTLDAYLLAKYDVVVRQLDKLNEADKKEPIKIAKVRGYLLCLQDTLDHLKTQPQPAPAPQPSRTTGQPRQARTLLGGLLAGRAQAVAADVMDALEGSQDGGGQ